MVRCGEGGLFSMGAHINEEEVKLLVMRFSEMLARGDDLSPIFKSMSDRYQKEVAKQFRTEGAWGGDPWVGLAKSTLKARERKRMGSKILYATGRLENSLTQSTSETINVVTPRMWAYGTSVEYGIYHQSKLPRLRLPRRAFLVVTSSFRLFVVRKIHRFIRGIDDK